MGATCSLGLCQNDKAGEENFAPNIEAALAAAAPTASISVK